MKQEKDIERMFRQHYEKMYNLARSILSDDDESKDVVSEVFTTILADDVVLMPESEEGFLMRSVRNRCLNLIAHKSVKERVTKLLLDDADVILSEETDERLDQLLTSSLRTPKIFVKEFSYFLMPCHQHCLGVNLLVQRQPNLYGCDCLSQCKDLVYAHPNL